METKTLTVVTGGASGIGAACVRHHVKRGDTVIVLDLASAWSDQKASSMWAKAFYDCDVLDDQRVRDVADLIEAEHGPVDNWITCAGILQRKLPPEDLPMDHWDAVTNIDLRGTYLSCAVYGSKMAARGHGAIVNIASQLGHLGAPGRAPYCSSKAGLLRFTQILAMDHAGDNIRVNSISPGVILTERSAARYGGKENAVRIRGPKHLLGRHGRVEEIAAAALYLASDEASFVTATDLLVDGGYVAFKGDVDENRRVVDPLLPAG